MDADLLIVEGNRLEDEGDLEQAEKCYREALGITNQPARVWLNIGNVLSAKGQNDLAKTCYLEVLQNDQSSVGAHANLGRLALLEADYETAIMHFAKAEDMSAGAQKIEILVSLAEAYVQLENAAQAMQFYHKVLELAPAHPWANFKLGYLLMTAGQLDQATGYLQKAVDYLPDNADAHLWLGKTLCDQGFVEEAIKHMQAAVWLQPDNAYRQGMYIFSLNYLSSISGTQLFEAQRLYVEKFCRSFYPVSPPRIKTANKNRKLRIGYVSSDFRQHPVSRFVEVLFLHHDRESFDIFCFYNHKRQDETTQRLKALVPDWHDVVDMDDTAVFGLIRSLEIDILIDLNGLTEGHRLQVFARKPAPVQVTWLGYLGTTGLNTMDYRICDQYTDPPGLTEEFHTETLLRMPDSQWCHGAYQDLPAIAPLPLKRNGYVTFGSFNNAAKLNDEVLSLWAKILASLPGSKISFSAMPQGRAQQRVVKIFARAGVSSSRIQFVPRLSYRDYLAAIGDVDIALDPFPYNGGTTSIDVLMMGVPFISLAGDYSIARGGCSVLANAGLTLLVAETPEDYVVKASALARNVAELERFRMELRSRMLASPLMDGRRFTLALEALYRKCG